MSKTRPMKISDAAERNIRKLCDDFAADLKQEMDIVQADQIRVSIDLNYMMPCPFKGVKVSISRFEQTEILYDGEIKDQ